MDKYVRFKGIPKDEVSSIYDGDLGVVGHELGVSCYEFVQYGGNIKIIVPSADTGAPNDLSCFLDDFKTGKIPAYIIKANQVGLGTYGEPVVKNVEILNVLELVELHDPPPKFKQDKTNLQLRIK